MCPTTFHERDRQTQRLIDTVLETGAEDIRVTHGRDDALVYELCLHGQRARSLSIVCFEDEDD